MGSDFFDDADYTYQEILDLSGTVQITCLGNNANCRRELTLFNIKDDPYELINVYDQNQDVGDQMMQDIMDAAASISEELIVVSDTTDEAIMAHENFPVNTGVTSTGWCDS